MGTKFDIHFSLGIGALNRHQGLGVKGLLQEKENFVIGKLYIGYKVQYTFNPKVRTGLIVINQLLIAVK